MAVLNFPSSPDIGDEHPQNGRTWQFNSSSWTTYRSDVARDDLSSESNGAISSVSSGRGWAGYGQFTFAGELDCLDDFSSESNGAISSVTGGDNWSGNGQFIYTIPTPDVFWAKFNEGTGTSFTSTVGSNGTVNNAGIWVTPGAGGAAAIKGNGSSYWGSTSGNLVFGSAPIITVHLRIKKASYNDQIIFLELCTAGGTIDNSVGLAIYTNFNLIGFNQSGGGLTYNGVNNCAAPSTGAWHSLLAVFNRTAKSVGVWVDGVSQNPVGGAFDSLAPGTVFQDKILHLLTRGDQSTFSDAELDDIRIWTQDVSDLASAIHNDTANA